MLLDKLDSYMQRNIIRGHLHAIQSEELKIEDNVQPKSMKYKKCNHGHTCRILAIVISWDMIQWQNKTKAKINI